MIKNQICIIMADGQAKRMSGLNKKKQLIEVNGEPIIARTIRQLRALGIEPVLATHYTDFDFLDVKKVVPQNNTHEITKFVSNKEYYKDFDETLFIWGDTCFDDCDIAEIVNAKPSLFQFFGTKYEIFGFWVRKDVYSVLEDFTNNIINKKDLDYGNTGSWGLLRQFGGYPLLPNPQGSVGGVTSVHEPDKYIAVGLLKLLPGKSIDCDGMNDIVELAKRFDNVEELEFTEDNGVKYRFIGGEWVKQ